jgi:hypothetical protein
MDELDLPLGRSPATALPHRATSLLLRAVLVVAVETAQALGPADGDEPSDVRSAELVEPELPKHGADVEANRALIATVRHRPLRLLHLGEPVIQVLPKSRRTITHGDSVRRGNEFCVLQTEFPDLLAQRPSWASHDTR